MNDPFEIPKSAVPEWMSYKWARKSVFGVEDTENIKRTEAAGWRPVPRKRHWNLPAAKMWDANSEWAEFNGMILMERPDHMTMAALADMRRKSFEMSGHIMGPRLDPNEMPYVAPKKSVWQRLMAAVSNKKQRG